MAKPRRGDIHLDDMNSCITIRNQGHLLISLLLFLLPVHREAYAQEDTSRLLEKRMSEATAAFVASLTEQQKSEILLPYESPLRFDWNYTPRNRKGLRLKDLDAHQQKQAMALLRTVLGAQGYLKAEQIIDLENVLRVLEKRPADDTYRDPGNYAFLVFGQPGSKLWGWRIEGHHLSLHFSSVNGRIAFLPGFMGSNPARVPPQTPQEGKQVLRDEFEAAFELLESFSPGQLKTVLLDTKAPHDIFTGNARKAMLEKREGIAMDKMSRPQQELFKKLIGIYLDRYHITLKNQQWAQLEKKGLGNIHFAWMGDTKRELGAGLGHYYRIHGPGILIEFDNTQNQGNHIHSVVRDLDNDFGEDLLRHHYEEQHR